MTLRTASFIPLILLMFLMFPPGVFAGQTVAEGESPATFVDRTHLEISRRLAVPSRWFDSFFQGPGVEEEPAGTSLRLRGLMIAEEGEGTDFSGRAKLRLRLPNLKRRFHLILSSEDNDLRDDSLVDSLSENEPVRKEEASLALQYSQENTPEFSLTHRVRIDWDDGLNPQLRSRVRYSLPVYGESVLTLAQAVFWEEQIGFGEDSRIDFDQPLNESMILRATANGLFSESSHGLEWLGMMQWLTTFSQKRALVVAAYVTGETRPEHDIVEYDTHLKYRQQVLKPWMFIELKPEVKWPRDNDYQATGIVTLSLEVQFDYQPPD